MPGAGSLAQLIIGKAREYVGVSQPALQLKDPSGNLLLDVTDTGWRVKAGTSAAGAITLAGLVEKITTESLTTAALAAYTLTITNSLADATDIALVTVANGSNAAGIPIVGRVVCGAGTITILIENQHATNAFNGTLVISVFLVKVA